MAQVLFFWYIIVLVGIGIICTAWAQTRMVTTAGGTENRAGTSAGTFRRIANAEVGGGENTGTTAEATGETTYRSINNETLTISGFADGSSRLTFISANGEETVMEIAAGTNMGISGSYWQPVDGGTGLRMATGGVAGTGLRMAAFGGAAPAAGTTNTEVSTRGTIQAITGGSGPEQF
jgi:hypothetical protein